MAMVIPCYRSLHTSLSVHVQRPPPVSLGGGARHVYPGHGLRAVQPEHLGNFHISSGLSARGYRIDEYGDRPFASAMRSDRLRKLVVASVGVDLEYGHMLHPVVGHEPAENEAEAFSRCQVAHGTGRNRAAGQDGRTGTHR